MRNSQDLSNDERWHLLQGKKYVKLIIRIANCEKRRKETELQVEQVPVRGKFLGANVLKGQNI